MMALWCITMCKKPPHLGFHCQHFLHFLTPFAQWPASQSPRAKRCTWLSVPVALSWKCSAQPVGVLGGDHLAPSDRVEGVWKFVCPKKEMSSSSERTIIECQEWFPIGFRNSLLQPGVDEMNRSFPLATRNTHPGPDEPRGWRMSEGCANTQGCSQSSSKFKIGKKKKEKKL